MAARRLIHLQSSEAVTDGAGVRIQRSVARRALHTFDPFLLLDEIASDEAADYIGGFPEHPHRGFETVTYMLEGAMKHRDHLGNEGLLTSGGVQWMTAGKGVLHSEMPQQEAGRLHGFQLWINLPAREKMSEPGYRDYPAADIPVAGLPGGGSIKVIAGEVEIGGKLLHGPVRGVTTRPDYFDIHLPAGSQLSLPVGSDKRVLIYVYHGEVKTGGDAIDRRQLAMLGEGDSVEIQAGAESRLLLLAAVPINEPVANRGPFVMNTLEEVEQAISDYRNGTLTD